LVICRGNFASGTFTLVLVPLWSSLPSLAICVLDVNRFNPLRSSPYSSLPPPSWELILSFSQDLPLPPPLLTMCWG
jgi:hypothetical protein